MNGVRGASIVGREGKWGGTLEPAAAPARKRNKGAESLELDEEALTEIAAIANSTSRDSGFTRGCYSYPAKFLAHLPHELIRRFSPGDGLVFDGYCGGGTTGLEAMLLGRRFLGYDINPFAILISRVKTTRLDPVRLTFYKSSLINSRSERQAGVLSDDDKQVLGPRAAVDVERLAWRVKQIPEVSYRDFFLLALIHCTKIVGRRDYRGNATRAGQLSLSSFDGGKRLAGPSVMPLFLSKVKKMIAENSTLPRAPQHSPEFILGSNHHVNLPDESVDLIVTSPPYKDLDVEYMQIQFQRPSLHRSKRSDVIPALLGVPPVDKDDLCGGKGKTYWENLRPSLNEMHRVLKPKHLAFWWVGFGTFNDREEFQAQLMDVGFAVKGVIPVTLSDNRAASSRSTHHGRETGMMKGDYLFVTVKS